MVEIFKTNVENEETAKLILALLHTRIALVEINFDLEDCDRILRIKGNNLRFLKIIQTVNASGYECYRLE